MIQNMKYIYEVYRQGSFSKAAKCLYLTQPALSMAVKKEEEKLGIQIFERGNTPIRLTEEGKTYIEAAKKIYEIETELVDDLQSFKDGGRGHVRIGAASIVMTYLLPDILAEFSARYPGVHVEVREDSYYTLRDLLKEEEIDLILETEWMDPEIESIRLFENHILLAIPKKTLLSETFAPLREKGMTAKEIQSERFLMEDAPSIEMKEVKDIPYLSLQPRNEIYGRAKMIFDFYKCYPATKMSFNQQRTSYQYAKKGFGAAFVSDTLIKSEGDHGELLYYRFDCPMPERYISIGYKKNRYLSHSIEAFVKTAQELFQI